MARNKNVYILGAGFSADAGVPLIANFLQVARENYDSPKSSMPVSLRKHYEAVFSFRQEAKQSRDSLHIDLENIEELFGVIEMAGIANRGRSGGTVRPSRSIKHLVAHVVSRYRPKGQEFEVRLKEGTRLDTLAHHDLLERFVWRDRTGPHVILRMNEYQLAAALFAGLFEVREDEVHDSVVTFNYDTILEQSLWSVGAQVDYRVERTAKVGSDVARPSEVSVLVCKMHGSSNWADVKKRAVRAHIFDAYDDFCENNEPIVVPPTWKKGELSKLLEQVWQRAAVELADATRVCIIGYSMPQTDLFFHHLMAASLSKNPSLYALHVVDKRNWEGLESPVDRRYRQRFAPLVEYGKYHFHSESLLGMLQPNLLHDLGRGRVILDVQYHMGARTSL